MKNIKFINLKNIFLLGLILNLLVSCEREISDEAQFAEMPKTAEIFTDDFVGMGTNFFFPFISDGAKADVFAVDKEVGHESIASIRIDVPDATDSDGNFAGAIFKIDGAGRNLTQYDALTFWAKSTQSATIGSIGFGEDKFLTLKSGVRFTTKWTKFIIPIPDPSKLINEKGMFLFSAGGIGTPGNEVGYSFWIDDLKFEKLGTIAQPRPKILNGENQVLKSFKGSSSTLGGLTQTFNLASGMNQTVSAAPSYFTFKSSNIEVARVSELGVVSVVGEGTAEITASIKGVKAIGSLTIEASGSFGTAPMPTELAADVISLFSDKYTNVPVDFFNGFYVGSTTQTADLKLGNDNFKYYSTLNYVGIEFGNPVVNATEMGFLHLDIWTNDDTSNNFIIKIRDRGANGTLNTDVNTGNPTEDDKEIAYTLSANNITKGQWVSIDIPLTGNIANQKNNLAQIVFVGDINFILDNLYFHK